MQITASTLGNVSHICHEMTAISGIEQFRREAVTKLTDLFSATSSAFLHWADAGNTPANLSRDDICFFRLADRYRDIYYEQVRTEDPITDWHLRQRRSGPGRGENLVTVFPGEALKDNPLDEYILGPNDSRDVLTISLAVDDRLVGNISLARSRRMPCFGEKELLLGRLLMPALSAAYSRLLILKSLDSREVTEAGDLRFSGLTRREREIVAHARKGLNSAEIGEELFISQWTVKKHLQSIYRKLGVHNRIELFNRLH